MQLAEQRRPGHRGRTQTLGTQLVNRRVMSHDHPPILRRPGHASGPS